MIAPKLTFAIDDASAAPFAAVPTIELQLRVEELSGIAVRSILLNTQVRIALTRRPYDARSSANLAEVLGQPSSSSNGVRSLLWTQCVTHVSAFNGRGTATVPIACTYDFETAVAKYFHVLEDGHIPIDVFFSGTVFHEADDGSLRTCLISHDCEAAYRMPVQVWKDVMDAYFPNSAWLRLRRDVFDRLYAFKTKRALPSWEDALELLLRE